MGKKFETTGFITKEENLTTINHSILKNTFVMEIVNPFFGYHGSNLPYDSKPESVFFVTDEKYSVEKTLRFSHKVKECCGFDYRAALATIILSGKRFYGIRINDLDSFEQLLEVQKLYKKMGVSFAKKKRIKESIPRLIKLRKFFQLEEIGKGMYADRENEHICYFQIPEHLDFEQFRKVTVNVKNQLSDPNFDVALGAIFHNNDIEDLVRVYSSKPSLDQLSDLKKRYATEIAKG